MPGHSGLACPWAQSSYSHILTTIQSAHFYRAGPSLGWATQLHGRNELSDQLSDRHAFNLVRSANNGTVLNRHRWNHMSQPIHRLRSAFIYITPWFFSTIANIANRASVSTYISQVTGNHPTCTGLSMAKHIFDPRPTQVQGIFLNKEVICIKCFHSTLIT